MGYPAPRGPPPPRQKDGLTLTHLPENEAGFQRAILELAAKLNLRVFHVTDSRWCTEAGWPKVDRAAR